MKEFKLFLNLSAKNDAVMAQIDPVYKFLFKKATLNLAGEEMMNLKEWIKIYPGTIAEGWACPHCGKYGYGYESVCRHCGLIVKPTEDDRPKIRSF